jgi:hypothetical protein
VPARPENVLIECAREIQKNERVREADGRPFAALARHENVFGFCKASAAFWGTAHFEDARRMGG